MRGHLDRAGERRREPRQIVRETVRVVTHRGEVIDGITLVDLSAGGARLEFDGQPLPGDTFVFQRADGDAYSCTPVWTGDAALGARRADRPASRGRGGYRPATPGH